MNNIVYYFKQSAKQFWRNKTMGFTSLLAITAMMLILGLFFVVSVNINLFSKVVEKDFDYVEFYLEDSVTESDADGIIAKLKNLNGVQEATYRSKEDALKIMKERWGKNGYLLDTLENNPLPNSILISVEDNKAAEDITAKGKDIKGVEDVKYYKETVEKLTKATDFIQLSAMVIMVFLIVVSVVVVANTIKLTVLARSKEISIMKYVGATNWFVRGPFVVEGAMMGIFSSLIAAGLTWLIYDKVEAIIGEEVMIILSSPLVPAGYMIWNLLIIFMAMGVSVGVCGSIISMRKFLDK
ncbi:MAG: permease-like cell division protein FtsX [Clostridiales bacterium]|nr:permease-like cell division protein FtsX [Clostridiales bacterium]MDD7348068.1 permease-like cell division protein FtsX [Clostridiales bacterium]MDY4059998.1 permease-like cell division protein FtsX [Anaerovoracaceae bacterium]